MKPREYLFDFDAVIVNKERYIFLERRKASFDISRETEAFRHQPLVNT